MEISKEQLEKWYNMLRKAETISVREPDKTLCFIGNVRMEILMMIKTGKV